MDNEGIALGNSLMVAARALRKRWLGRLRKRDKVAQNRPEALRFAEEAPAGWPRLTGTVARIEILGPLTRLDVTLANGTLLKMATLDAPHHVLAPSAVVSLEKVAPSTSP